MWWDGCDIVVISLCHFRKHTRCYLLRILHYPPFLVFTSSSIDKMLQRHLSRLFTVLMVRQMQVTVAQFPSWSNKGTEKAHISIMAPLGAIRTILNESLHFPPPLSCDALRSLVFSYYNSNTGKRTVVIKDSLSSLAAGTMTHLRLSSTVCL